MEFEELRALKECIIDIDNTIPAIVGDGSDNKAVKAYYIGKQIGRARDIVVKAYREASSKAMTDPDPQESEE